MLPLGPLLALALSSLREQWRGSLALLAGAVIVTTALAAVPIYEDLIRGVALREALDSAGPRGLELRVVRDGLAIDPVAYRDAQDALDGAVAEALGQAGAGPVRMGTSGPLELRTAPPVEGEPGTPLGRAALRFRGDAESHVELIEGRFPNALPRGLGDPIPVLVAVGTATAADLAVGQQLELRPPGSLAATPPIPVEIVGVAAARDPGGAYWGDRPELLETSADGALVLLVPETTFFGAIPDLLRDEEASFESQYALAPGEIGAADVEALAARVRDLPGRLAALGGAAVETRLPETLAGAGEAAGFDRAALALLFGQLAAAAGFLVYALSGTLVRRRRAVHELLQLNGAGSASLMAIEALAVLPLALLALLLGAPLAALAVAALGRLGSFEPFADGGWLTVELGAEAFAFAAVGAAAVLALSLAPSYRAAFAAGRPRAGRTRRRWAAALLAGAAGLGFWALTRNETLFETTGGVVQTEHALLLAPAALLLPAVLVAGVLVPLLARPLAWLVAASRSVALLGGFRTIAREALGAAFPLTIVAAAIAVLAATLPATLERSPQERAAHAAGADIRAAGLPGLEGAGEAAIRTAIDDVPADAASPAVRLAGELRGELASAPVELLAIDPTTFAEVASFREDFAPEPLPAILSALASNATALDGLAVPDGTRQLGAWVSLPEIGGEASVAVSLWDAEGRYAQLLLGRTELDGATAQTWRFFAADLETPLALDGTPLVAGALRGPLTLHGYYLVLDEAAAAAPGVALFGPLFASTDPPDTPRDTLARLGSLGEAFPRRAILHDLATSEGFEPIADLDAGQATTGVRSSSAGPPGFEQAQRIGWDGAGSGAPAPVLRGLRQETDGAPVLLYVSQEALDRLEVAPGAELTLAVAGRLLRAQVAGRLDQFPTFPADAAFAVAGLERLRAAVNASPNTQPLGANEAWFASRTPSLTASALRAAPLEALTVVERESELAALSSSRITALGWRGVLTLSLAALLILAVVAALTDWAASEERRSRELATIEVLGGSRAAQLATTAWETAIRLGAAAAIGSVLAFPLARWLLDILGRDPDGNVIVPPLRVTLESGPLWLAAAVLAATFVVVAGWTGLRYRRVSAQRALRIGEA